MRLTDLNPRWVSDGADGRGGMGVAFDCPHCRETRVRVFFDNPIDGGAPIAGHLLWARQGATFDDLTLHPSIDASASGHWHGFVTSGEVQ